MLPSHTLQRSESWAATARGTTVDGRRLNKSLAVMNRGPRAMLIALVLGVSMTASADAGPSVRFDVSIPGAQPEQIERDFVNIVESRLQARASVFQIRATASQFEASIQVLFEKAPTCAELAQIAAIVARAVPPGGSIPEQRLENLKCEQ